VYYVETKFGWLSVRYGLSGIESALSITEPTLLNIGDALITSDGFNLVVRKNLGPYAIPINILKEGCNLRLRYGTIIQRLIHTPSLAQNRIQDAEDFYTKSRAEDVFGYNKE